MTNTTTNKSNLNNLFGLLKVSYRMLLHDRKKFIGMIIGASMTAFMMLAQFSIYEGVVFKLNGFLLETKDTDLWVVHKKTKHHGTATNFSKMDLYSIRGINGVKSVTPAYRVKIDGEHISSGIMQTFKIRALDSYNLKPFSDKMFVGNYESIKQPNTVILDASSIYARGYETNGSIFKPGDQLIINGVSVTIVGIKSPSSHLYGLPMLYMSSSTLRNIVKGRHLPGYILVKAEDGADITQLAKRIEHKTDFGAFTTNQFVEKSLEYFESQSPILRNFVIMTTLSFISGLLIVAGLFYNFTLSNISQFGILKLLGVHNKVTSLMVFFQGMLIGISGYVFGIFLTLVLKIIFNNSHVMFLLKPWILGVIAVALLLLIVIAALLSLIVILRQDTIEICQKTS